MKRYAVIPLALLIAACLLCSCVPEAAPKPTEEPGVYLGKGYPVEVIYERSTDEPVRASTGDRSAIDEIISALSALKLFASGEHPTGRTDTITFVYEDGSEESIVFVGGMWLKDGVYYEAEGYDELAEVLEGIRH